MIPWFLCTGDQFLLSWKFFCFQQLRNVPIPKLIQQLASYKQEADMLGATRKDWMWEKETGKNVHEYTNLETNQSLFDLFKLQADDKGL